MGNGETDPGERDESVRERIYESDFQNWQTFNT
jgi:hypothetical protein